jgi:ribosomal protein S18 acetylase RimI-like enzyme
MECMIIDTAAGVKAACVLALEGHRALRRQLRCLPVRTEAELLPKLEWMAANGRLYGLFEGSGLAAFLGGCPLGDFRNAGQAGYGPDWCSGMRADRVGAAGFRDWRLLYRSLAGHWHAQGWGIHAFGVHDSNPGLLEALQMSGFGRIMLDAARPLDELLRELPPLGTDASGGAGQAGLAIRRAQAADAGALAGLDDLLARHIGASPVLMPGTRGRDAGEGRDWLEGERALAFLAEAGGRAVGFIKAQEPQFDVSQAVHAPDSRGINGMVVMPEWRGRGIGGKLLSALCAELAGQGLRMLSVDCETLNPEAFDFWRRWFRPVSWGLERRTA